MSSQRQKGSPHPIVRSAAITSLALSSVLAGRPPPGADDAVSLAHVAHQLGFHYTYLAFENAVSLARPGATVVVRPGDPFFSANERREPVFGMVPQYRGNDVYVSRAFIGEIRGLGHPFGRPASAPVVMRRERSIEGHVSELHLSQAAEQCQDHRQRQRNSGLANRDRLARRAVRKPPEVVLDRATTFSDASGAFATVVSTAPDYFYASRFIVEASGAGDTAPTVARIDRMEQNPALHTDADNLEIKY